MNARRITLFFATIIAALALISFIFPEEGITIGGHTCYFPSLKKLIESNQRVLKNVEESNFTPPTTIDTELNDSIATYQAYLDSSDIRFWLPDSLYLDAFWDLAERAKGEGRTIRILHYGDSQIEADRLTAQLRSYMQKTFGGGGPGMIPASITTPTAAFWVSGGNLTHLSSFGDSTVTRSNGNYGVMMQSFRMNGGTSINIRASSDAKADDAIKQFSQVRFVFNNKGKTLKATLSNNKLKYNDQQQAPSGVGSLFWTLDSAVNRVTLKASGTADLYCITLDDGPGVAVDNIPMRGCSGQQFSLVKEELLSAAYEQLDVAMVIMEFGGNSVPYLKSGAAISTYCRSIGKQIDHVHRCCPQAKILFIGPSDMSTRHHGELQSYPDLPALIDSLIVTVNKHDAAHWSIYHAMGGWNTMVEWNRQGLAGSDYVHFTPKGAVIMGNRLAEAFDLSYRLFGMRRKLTIQ